MKTVQPIRDEKKIEAMKKILKGKSLRDYAFFTLGINTGLRISDILNFTFGDVLNGKTIVDKVTVLEKKTKKSKSFSFSPNVKKALKEYIDSVDSFQLEDPLFFSRQTDKYNRRKSITRQQAYNIINYAAEFAGVEEAVGTHTLRKTFGYHAYQRGVDLALLQKMFNHSSQSITLDYIGITQDQMDEVYISMNL